MLEVEDVNAFLSLTNRDILWVQLVLLPYWTFQYISWYVRWVWKFGILREEYGDEEKLYIIRKNMGMSGGQFDVSSWGCRVNVRRISRFVVLYVYFSSFLFFFTCMYYQIFLFLFCLSLPVLGLLPLLLHILFCFVPSDSASFFLPFFYVVADNKYPFPEFRRGSEVTVPRHGVVG